jgi:hypothetical protein
VAGSSSRVVVVGVLSADVVEGSRLHVVPSAGRPASVALPPGWRCESAEIRDATGTPVARLGERVTLTGEWIEGLVALRGPSRVLRVRSIRPAVG